MIQNQQQRPAIKGFVFISLLLMYTIAYNLRWRGTQALWFASVFLAGISLIFVIITKRKWMFRMNFMSGWMLVVYAYFCLSLLWASNKTFANPLKSLIIIFGISILLLAVIDTMEDVRRLVLINYLAILFCALYLVTTVDLSLLGTVRLGSSVEGAWNANDISGKMCIGISFSVYLLKYAKGKLKKAFLILSMLLFLVLILFCGSRTGFLLLAMLFVFYLFVSARGIKVFRAVVISVAFSIVAYYLIMNWEPAYNVLGSRVETLLRGLAGGNGDGSFNWRRLMLEEGWRYFKENPVFGYGIDSFRYMFGIEKGLETYSHNTFIEILVSGGMVGFLLYYSLYVFILLKLWKYAIRKKEPLAITIFVVNLASLIGQFSSMAYYEMETYLLLACGVLYVLIVKKEELKHEQSAVIFKKSAEPYFPPEV